MSANVPGKLRPGRSMWPMTYVDTNVILRYLLDDDPRLSTEAKVWLEKPEEKQTGIEVVAECVYVLTGVYRVPRKETAEILATLFSHESWKLYQKNVVLSAIKLYGASSIDFVDAYLISLHRITDVDILSFDKKLRQMTGS
jgi:predicted nucleic-acid-binding protein